MATFLSLKKYTGQHILWNLYVFLFCHYKTVFEHIILTVLDHEFCSNQLAHGTRGRSWDHYLDHLFKITDLHWFKHDKLFEKKLYPKIFGRVFVYKLCYFTIFTRAFGPWNYFHIGHYFDTSDMFGISLYRLHIEEHRARRGYWVLEKAVWVI